MTAPNAMMQSAFMLAQDLNTRGLQGWIQDNVIPLVLLGIAIILLWIGGRGDNAGVARRSVGLIVGLIALGIAVSGNGNLAYDPFLGDYASDSFGSSGDYRLRVDKR